jgi:galactokinase
MDQLACSVGGLIHIDFLDKLNPSVQKISFDFNKVPYYLCIIDVRSSHAGRTDDYACISNEMHSIAKHFHKNVLREVNADDFYEKLSSLREKEGDRCILRAIHFFEEEKRVVRQITALQNDNFQEFLFFIRESGISSSCCLQNIYSSLNPQEQELSIALALSEIILGKSGTHGVSRVHGGGFAGTIQAFVEKSFIKEYQSKMDAVFGKDSVKIFKIRQQGSSRVM